MGYYVTNFGIVIIGRIKYIYSTRVLLAFGVCVGNLAEWFGPVKEKSKRRKFRSSWIGCGATNIQMRLYLIHLLKGD